MDKMNYLFDACVPHCSTQKRIQRGLDDFFAKQEELYQDWYKRKHPNEDIRDSKNNYDYAYDYAYDYDDDDYDYDDYDDDGYGYDYIDDDDDDDDEYDYDWV